MKGTKTMAINVADISAFENIQSQANQSMGFSSSMSVFNGADPKKDIENEDEDDVKNEDGEDDAVKNAEEKALEKVANAVSDLVDEKVKNADADKTDEAVKNAEGKALEKVANAVSDLVDEKVKNAEAEKEQPVKNGVLSDAAARKDSLKNRH
jgi:hypothetical protein